jgi:hypothetical protein
MQFSNGLTNPLGLWLGHLMFDTVWTLILSTLIIVVFATASNVFNGLGFFVSKTRVDSQPLMTKSSGLYWCCMELLGLCLHIAQHSLFLRPLPPLPLLPGIKSSCLS